MGQEEFSLHREQYTKPPGTNLEVKNSSSLVGGISLAILRNYAAISPDVTEQKAGFGQCSVIVVIYQYIHVGTKAEVDGENKGVSGSQREMSVQHRALPCESNVGVLILFAVGWRMHGYPVYG